MRVSGRAWLAAAACAVVAIVRFWPALAGGLLSDDYLLNAFCDASQDEIVVDWGTVFADFSRPWLGHGSSFYRPMLSVSLGLDLWLGSGSPFVMHLTNLALHVGITVMAAALCGLFGSPRPVLAALLGGLFVALHPVATEPVCWIAARNSELEVFFRTAALLTFALWLRIDCRISSWLCVGFTALALASKESAVILPVSMLALDLIDRPDRSLGRRLALHLRFVPLWIGYFALRLTLFGGFVGTGGSPGADAWSASTIATHSAGKLSALVCPHGPTVDPGLGWIAFGLWFALLAAAGLASRRGRWLLGVGAACIVLHTMPTYRLVMQEDLGGARMIYGALPILALTSSLLCTATWPRIGTATMLLVLATLWPATGALLDRYERAWQDMRDATSGIEALSDDVDEARPLALASMPQDTAPIPPCNPNAWFPFAERPVQPHDIPFVSLGWVTLEVPGSETLYHDASAIRALWHAGATIATWEPATRQFLHRQRTRTLEPLELNVADAALTYPTPVSGDLIEVVTLRFDRAVSRGTLTLRTDVPLPPELGTLRFGADGLGARDSFQVDVSHSIALASLATVGATVRGFTVATDPAAAVTAAASKPRVEPLATTGRLEGATVPLSDLAEQLPQPIDRPAGRTFRVVLLCPHTALPIEDAAKPLRIPDAVRDELRTISGLARQDRVYFFWETTRGRQYHARSDLDWFQVAR